MNAKSKENWAEFWAGNHSIYVSARHLEAHYTRIATDLLSTLGDVRGKRILDWGCGDAMAAPALAREGGEIFLYDPMPEIQKRLQTRFAAVRGISILGSMALPEASLDAIVMNSVAQYLTEDQIRKALDDFHHLLAPGGVLILGDIIPPDAGMMADIAALLGPAARHGYLIAACSGLARTFFSDYRRLRQAVGLACYREEEITGLLARHGFAAERLVRNIGFNQRRMGFRARPV